MYAQEETVRVNYVRSVRLASPNFLHEKKISSVSALPIASALPPSMRNAARKSVGPDGGRGAGQCVTYASLPYYEKRALARIWQCIGATPLLLLLWRNTSYSRSVRTEQRCLCSYDTYFINSVQVTREAKRGGSKRVHLQTMQSCSSHTQHGRGRNAVCARATALMAICEQAQLSWGHGTARGSGSLFVQPELPMFMIHCTVFNCRCKVYSDIRAYEIKACGQH